MKVGSIATAAGSGENLQIMFLDSYSGLYWLTRLDGFKSLFIFCVVAGLVISLILLIGGAITRDLNDIDEPGYDTGKSMHRQLKWIVPLTILLALVNALVPTRNEMIIIVAGGKTLDYIQSDTSLKKIPYQTTKIVSDYLDKTIKELKSEEKKVIP